ncbi:MAG: HAD-IA family hydrolase [Clostridia bacterium]|nr:HAD-IA family hydrolase [Clostridia bacterium]
MPKKAVLFDLDGTLCDTLGDLTASMNYVLRTFDYPVHTVQEMRTFVGNGLKMQVRRAMPNDAPDVHLMAGESLFLAHYAKHCTELTAPYPGMEEAVARLRAAGLRLAVVTNKPHDCAVRVIAEKFQDGTFDLVRGAKPGGPLKPDPALLNEAMAELGVSPAEAVYVGDSDVDVAFAHAAGLQCLGCAWGFRGREHLERGGADAIAEQPTEMADRLLREDI